MSRAFEHLVLRALVHIINQQTQHGDDIMALRDDLNAAVAALNDQAAQNHTDITAVIAALQASASANDPAVQAAITSLQGITATLKADDAAAEAAVTPPAPAPTPTPAA